MLQNLFSGPVSSKNRMVGAFCGRFAFATATTVEELRNYYKTLQKAPILGSLFGRKKVKLWEKIA